MKEQQPKEVSKKATQPELGYPLCDFEPVLLKTRSGLTTIHCQLTVWGGNHTSTVEGESFQPCG
jgi:hypothetical protein